MPEIPEIKTTGISINDVEIREIPMWRSSPTGGLPTAPPVTVNIGVPIVDMPGCVEAHEQNTNRERSGIISEDDPKGVRTYCDAGIPSFNPIDYNKEELQFTGPPKAPVTKTESPKPPTPEVKSEDVKPPAPPTTNIECPTKVQQAQEPVGTLVEGFRKKVVRYEFCLLYTSPSPRD